PGTACAALSSVSTLPADSTTPKLSASKPSAWLSRRPSPSPSPQPASLDEDSTPADCTATLGDETSSSSSVSEQRPRSTLPSAVTPGRRRRRCRNRPASASNLGAMGTSSGATPAVTAATLVAVSTVVFR
ncbi:unnamed protein product, partial [Ectocarpus sp. 12 AP-2014]